MSESMPKIPADKIIIGDIPSKEVKSTSETPLKPPIFPSGNNGININELIYGDEYVTQTHINQVPTKLTYTPKTGAISAGYRADDVTLSKMAGQTVDAAGAVIGKGAEAAAEGVVKYCKDTKEYLAPKFQAIGDAWYYSDIGALCRGDFKTAWEINRDSYVKPIAKGEFGEALDNFGKGNKALSTAVGLELAKDVAGGDALRTTYHSVKKAVDDGDDTSMTFAEKAVAVVGATGEVVDDILTPVGIATVAATPAVLAKGGMAMRSGSNALASSLTNKGAVTLANTVKMAPEAITTTAKVAGGTMVASGSAQVIGANTEQEVKDGTHTVINGAMLYGAANAVGKSANVLETTTPVAKNPKAKPTEPAKPVEASKPVEAPKPEVVKTPRERLVAETAERLEWNKGVLERAEAKYQAQTKTLKKTIREGSSAEKVAAKKQLKIEQENINAARTSFKAEQNRVSQAVKNAVEKNPEIAIKGEKGSLTEKNIVKEANALNNQKAKATADAKNVKAKKSVEAPKPAETAKPVEQPEVKFSEAEETLLKKYEGTKKNAEYWEKMVKNDKQNVEFCEKNPTEGGPVEDAIAQLEASQFKAQKFRSEADALKGSIPADKLKAWEVKTTKNAPKPVEASKPVEPAKVAEPVKTVEQPKTPLEKAEQRLTDAERTLADLKDKARVEKSNNAKDVKDLKEIAKRQEKLVQKLEKGQKKEVKVIEKNYNEAVKKAKSEELKNIKTAKKNLAKEQKRINNDAQLKEKLAKKAKADEAEISKIKEEAANKTKILREKTANEIKAARLKSQKEIKAQKQVYEEKIKIQNEQNTKFIEDVKNDARTSRKDADEKLIAVRNANKDLAKQIKVAKNEVKAMEKDVVKFKTSTPAEKIKLTGTSVLSGAVVGGLGNDDNTAEKVVADVSPVAPKNPEVTASKPLSEDKNVTIDKPKTTVVSSKILQDVRKSVAEKSLRWSTPRQINFTVFQRGINNVEQLDNENYFILPMNVRRINPNRNINFNRFSPVGMNGFRLQQQNQIQNQRFEINPIKLLNAIIDLLIRYVENIIANMLRMMGF